MEKAKIDVVSTKKNAKKVLSLMNERKLEELVLVGVTQEQLLDFISKKRKNLAIFAINGEDLLEVEGSSSSAALLLKLLQEVEEAEMVFPPISKANVEDFLGGKRTTLLTMDLVHKPDGEPLSDDDIEEVESL